MKKIIKTALVIVLSFVIVIGAKIVVDTLPGSAEQGVAEEFLEAYPDAKELKEISVDEKVETINKIYEVSEGSSTVGYIFDATSPKGYAGEINFLIGISKEGIIKGFKPVSHSETQGFGSRMEEAEFKDGVKEVNISNGLSAGKGDKEKGEIIAMSGATVTTNALLKEFKAVVNTLSKLSDEVKPVIDEIPYFADKYEELLPKSVENYTFEELKKEGFYNDNVIRIIKVKENGDFNSYIIQLKAQGYGGDIDLLVRVNDEYRVYDTLVVNHNETENFGKHIEDSEYKEELKGLNLKKNFLTKAIKIKKSPKGEKDILLISGATVTSQAMQKALNAAIEALVKFDQYKENSENFVELNYEEMLAFGKKEAPSYNHQELFKGIESSEKIEDKSNDTVVGVSKVIKDGEEGYIFDVNAKGFAGTIEYGIYTGLDGQIKDFVVYSSNESEGYGDAILSDSYKTKLLGNNLSKIDSIKAGDQVEAISGATITTTGMEASLNQVLEMFKSLGQ